MQNNAQEGNSELSSFIERIKKSVENGGSRVNVGYVYNNTANLSFNTAISRVTIDITQGNIQIKCPEETPVQYERSSEAESKSLKYIGDLMRKHHDRYEEDTRRRNEATRSEGEDDFNNFIRRNL